MRARKYIEIVMRTGRAVPQWLVPCGYRTGNANACMCISVKLQMIAEERVMQAITAVALAKALPLHLLLLFKHSPQEPGPHQCSTAAQRRG